MTHSAWEWEQGIALEEGDSSYLWLRVKGNCSGAWDAPEQKIGQGSFLRINNV
jgi:hypothetical protein